MSFIEDLRGQILRWDAKHPYDLLWRQKYNIPFGSPQHLSMSFIDMFVALEEEKMLKELEAQKTDKKDKEENELLGLDGSVKKVVELNKKEVDNEFDNLDISKFATNNVGKEDTNKP